MLSAQPLANNIIPVVSMRNARYSLRTRRTGEEHAEVSTGLEGVRLGATIRGHTVRWAEGSRS